MFVVIDGIDGAGKGRQRTELVNFFADKDLKVSTTDFPDHQGHIYKNIIHPALHEEIEMTPQTWFLSFVLDQMLWSSKINPTIGSKDRHFISDGYFTTTLAYQCKLSKMMSVEDALDLATRFVLPVPDLVIFIDVDPKIAMDRKMDEDGHDEGLDIFERSLKKQEKIREAFLDLARNQVWTRWAVVDGSDSIEEVSKLIQTTLLKYKII